MDAPDAPLAYRAAIVGTGRIGGSHGSAGTLQGDLPGVPWVR